MAVRAPTTQERESAVAGGDAGVGGEVGSFFVSFRRHVGFDVVVGGWQGGSGRDERGVGRTEAVGIVETEQGCC